MVSVLGYRPLEDDCFNYEICYIVTHPLFKGERLAKGLIKRLRQSHRTNFLIQSTPDSRKFWLKMKDVHLVWNESIRKKFSSFSDTADYLIKPADPSPVVKWKTSDLISTSIISSNKKLGELRAVNGGILFFKYKYSPENHGIQIPSSEIEELTDAIGELRKVLTDFNLKFRKEWKTESAFVTTAGTFAM